MELYDDLEKTLCTLREIIIDIPKRHELNKEQIKSIEDELNDLVHYMELCDLSGSEGFKAYKETQRLRRERRLLKNENELISPMVGVLNGLKSQEKNIEKAISKVRDAKVVQENRSYRTRVRHELAEKINKKAI